MPELITENGITFEVEGEVSAEGVLQSEDEGEVSPKPATPAAEPASVAKTETPAYEYNPRRASAMLEPAVAEEDPEKPAETPATSEPPAELTEEEEAAAEAELDAYLESLLAEKVDERTRGIQSTKDKEVAKVAEENRKSQERITALEAQLEEAKLEGLTDEEREEYLNSKQSEKDRKEMSEAADELQAMYHGRLLDVMETEYSPYGVTREEMETFESPEDLEKFCEKSKALYLRISGGREPAEVAAAITTPAEPAKPAAEAKPVPAGATAPADVGGGAPTLGARSNGPSTEQSTEGMAQTMNSLPWESVPLR